MGTEGPVIVRTTPRLPVSPDVLRVLERLESQLRRAADDLAEAIADMEPATAYEPPAPMLDRMSARCLQIMRSGQLCGRFSGHRNDHRSIAALDSDMERKRRARVAA